MRPTSTAVLLLLVLAGCSAFGVAGSGPGTSTLTPASVPTVEEPTPTATPEEPAPATVLVANAMGREYVVTLSVVDGPVSTVELFYADGGSAVVDHAADPSGLAERVAEGSVVDVRVPDAAGTERYRVDANASSARRAFPVLDRAGAGTSLVWVVAPARESGVPSYVTAAGIETCSPPHSLVTEFRVRLRVDTDGVRVDCA